MFRFMYVDRNKKLLTEGELAAFGILHPEEKGEFYHKILLCGICYSQLSRQTEQSTQRDGATYIQTITKKDSL